MVLKKKTGRLHIRLDGQLLERAKKLASKKGLTLTTLVELTLRDVIEANKQQEKLDKEPPVVDAEQV